MPIGHLLEDFGAYATGNPVSLTDVSLEEQRLEAFEKGYQAGWDDSVKAQSEETTRISTDFAQNLHELSFTYQESYMAVLKSLKPLMQQMVETVLPQAAHHTLGSRLIELLNNLAAEHGEQTVEIVTAPTNIAALEHMLRNETSLPLTLIEESSLGEGQAHIRFGDSEREINLAEVLTEIDRAVTGFFEENQKEIA